MYLFVTIFCSVLFYLNYLIGDFYVDALAITGAAKAIFWTIHILMTIAMIATPFVYRMYPVKRPGFFYNALQWVGYFFFGLYSVMIVLMFVDWGGLFLYSKIASPPENKYLMMKTAVALLTAVVTFFVSIAGIYEARRKPQIVKVKIPLKNLPDDFVGVKILQMSDVHVGQTIRKSFVDTLVNMTNEIAPDMVVLTGDMIDGVYDQLSDELQSFKNIQAPLGKFMVPGNHEYYWGINDWLVHWREMGFKTLLNEHVVVENKNSKIIMSGVHDYSARRMGGKHISSPSEALANTPDDLVKILLAHQPRTVYEAHKAGAHVQLSGHTHSGQYFPYNILIYLFQPYVKGLNKHKNTWIYVNQGTGYWGPPSRFGVPPEITLIELTKEAGV